MAENDRCHICQEKAKLTFEHIPPHKAFNWKPAKSIESNEIMKLITDDSRMPWETQGLRYKSKQRGMGLYSLCCKCNNLTGKYYGNEYIKFAYIINELFPQIIKNCEEKQVNIAGIEIKGMKPLLFAKQVLSMFCSICPNITKKDDSVKDLLLNKDKTGLDPNKYRLSMFLLKNNRISYKGMQGQICSGGIVRMVAEIDVYPFGFILEFNPKDNFTNSELDITNFFNDYENKEYNMEFGIPVLERNNIFTFDYRTKKEIRKCIESDEISNTSDV